MELRPAEVFADRAVMIMERERELLVAHAVPGELSLTGGTSVPGALTKGDVDLHLRVAPADFALAVSRLEGLHAVVLPEIWQPSLATFAVEAALPTGLAVTPIGSEHDLRFIRTWQLLGARPDLVAEYNALKLRHRDGGVDYERAKSAFFDDLVDKASGPEPE